MTLLRPMWMQHTGADPAIQYSGLELRNLLAGVYRSEGVIRHGSSGAAALQAIQRGAGANFSVDVNPGYAIISGDDVANQGMYVISADATTNVVTPGAPGSGTRVHRLVAQIRDKFHNGSYTTYEWTLDLLQDTGSGTPALPNSAIPLARISIAAGQSNVSTANITDDRVDAMMLLGRGAYVSSDATRPPNPVDGEETWRTDFNGKEIYAAGPSTWYRGTPFPAAVLRQSATQAFTTATLTPVTYDTEDLDTHNGHSTSSNTSRYVIPAGWGGLWRVAVNTVWAASTGGSREQRVAVNGTLKVMVGRYQPGNSSVCTVSGETLISVNAGDYIECIAQQDSGGSLSTSANNSAAASTMSLSWARPA